MLDKLRSKLHDAREWLLDLYWDNYWSWRIHLPKVPTPLSVLDTEPKPEDQPEK